MSSFKNFAPMLSSLQDQADGKGTIAGSPLEDFLSIAGYETPGGGGGGSSDFSTAQVTIDNQSGTNVYGNVYGQLTDVSSYCGLSPNTLPTVVNSVESEFGGNTSYDYTVVLYRGHTIVGIFIHDVVTVSGSATKLYDSEDGGTIIEVTGDCTITITA